MTTKKQLIKQIEELKKTLTTRDDEFATQQDILRNLQVKVAEIRRSVLDDKKNDNSTTKLIEKIYKLSEYNKITENIIPESLRWQYWIWINEMANLWVSRYSDFKETEDINKNELILAIRCAVMYGRGIYSKKNKTAYWLCKIEKDKYFCTPCAEFMSDQYACRTYKVDGKDVYKLDKKYTEETKNHKYVELTKDDVVDMSFQSGYVGIFIWYLIYGCLDILTTMYVACNSSSLINKLALLINDPEKFKDEIKYWMSYKTNIVPIFGDGELDLTKGDKLGGGTNGVLNIKGNNVVYEINQLIDSNKFIVQKLHNLYGIPITSAKNQSLSADANLSASTTEWKMYEHDRRILDPINKVLKLNVKPRELDAIKYDDVQNQNADKDANGIANTDGQKNTEKVK